MSRDKINDCYNSVSLGVAGESKKKSNGDNDYYFNLLVRDAIYLVKQKGIAYCYTEEQAKAVAKKVKKAEITYDKTRKLFIIKGERQNENRRNY